MKKVLIASTALVAAGLMTTGAASASEKIKLNLGGFSKWWVVGAWQQGSFENASRVGYSNVDVKGDNEVFFGGSTTLDNGLKVGVDVQLEAGGHLETAAGTTTSTDVIDESYVWVEGGFGKLIVGSENNGVYLLHVNAPDAAGNWGEGNMVWYSVVQPTNVTGFTGGNGTAPRIDNDADKLTYVAPTFYGLTVGASFVPNAGNSSNKGEDNYNQPYSGNVYGVGALYANTFGGVGVKLSTGYIWGDAQPTVASDFWQYVAGAQLSYAGFTVGGSYRIDMNDNNAKVTTLNASNQAQHGQDVKGWDAGVSYAQGPWAVSFAYFQSEARGAATVGEDKIELYQVSGKYTLGAGVDVLASVGHAKYEDEVAKTTANEADHNKGWAVMTGLSLAF